jgi:hypothetical protein
MGSNKRRHGDPHAESRLPAVAAARRCLSLADSRRLGGHDRLGTLGDPGNACDTQTQGCFGAVFYTYRIAKQEVTNAQYAEFLNAKAASDPLGLYNTEMGSTGFGGISRNGGSGSYTYSVIAGREDKPVNYVSYFDALRFANWLNNGQGGGDTETGAYTLLGGLPRRATNWWRATPGPRSSSPARTSGTRRPSTTPGRRATSTPRPGPMLRSSAPSPAGRELRQPPEHPQSGDPELRRPLGRERVRGLPHRESRARDG